MLNDLGPAATFIAANYAQPFNIDAFERAAQRVLDDLAEDVGWMYETLHTDGKTKARINFTVWTELFSCPECAGEINFFAEAFDKETKGVRASFPCPHCTFSLTKKDALQKSFESMLDPATQQPWQRIRLKPVRINYKVGDKTHEKDPTAKDLAL